MTSNGLSRRREKEIRSLSKKKYRDRLGEMMVEGMRSVESAVNAGAHIREVLVTAEAYVTAREFLGGTGASVVEVSRAEIERIASVETSQGIVAVVSIEPVDPEALISMQRIVAFDGIRDPGNAGTLIRTAAWFGVDAVVTAAGTVDLYNPKVVRSAMGGLWDVALVPVDELAARLETLRGAGFSLYAADLDGTTAARWVPNDPSVLVFGSEAHGISERIGKMIDERIQIPGRPKHGAVESLNVAVAGGIVLYEWTRGRKSR